MVAALPEILKAEMKEKGPSLSHTIGYLLGWGVVEIAREPLKSVGIGGFTTHLATTKAHNIHKRQTSVFPGGLDHKIPASQRRQAHVLDRAVSGIFTLYTSS